MKAPSGIVSALSGQAALIAPVVIYLATTPYLVGQLGVPEYGVLVLILSVAALLNGVDFGLGAAAVLSLGTAISAGDTHKARRLHREFVTALSFTGLMFGAILFASAPTINGVLNLGVGIPHEKAVRVTQVTAVYIALLFMISAGTILPRALERIPGVSAVQMVLQSGIWLTAALTVWAGFGVVEILAGAAALAATTFIGCVVWNSRLLPGLDWRPTYRMSGVLSAARFGMHSFLGQVSSVAMYQADKLFIAHYLGPAAVAYYGVATNTAGKLLSLVAASAGFLFPRAISLHASGRQEEVRAFYQRAKRYMLLFLMPLMAPSLALSEPALRVWLGPDIADNSTVSMQLLLVAYGIAALSVVPANVFNGMGRAGVSASYASVGVAVNLVMCALLIPSYGPSGAGWAAVLGMAQAAVFMVFVESRLGFDWFRLNRSVFLRLAPAMFVQAALVLLTRSYVEGWWSLLSIGFASWAIFYVFWFAAPLASAEDWRMLKRVFGRA